MDYSVSHLVQIPVNMTKQIFTIVVTHTVQKIKTLI